MQFLSKCLVVGAALHGALATPLSKRAPDEFIKKQTPIALERLLCNIGSDGCHAYGAAPGAVVASPDRVDPPYYYTWTRDSALVFKSLVDRFAHTYDAGLQKQIQNYVISQAKLQGISNPSGVFSDGTGLGEAKFNVDLTAYTGNWGRPQRDGPPLRAIALISYGKWLIANGYTDTARNVIWPIARNDLEYVAQYWTHQGFDLWEEVSGNSFFATASQHRALVEGAAFAASIGQSGTKYSNIAPHVLCYMQRYWVSNGGYIDSNINTNEGRTGKDAASILASIHTFDAGLGCDANTFQPCSDKALSNLKSVADSMRWWGINSGKAANQPVSVGRYSEDVYYGGNPWYLTTLAAAEQLYDAIYVWKARGSIQVTATSLSFFRDLVPNVAVGTYASNTATYTTLLNAVQAHADGFVDIVAQYTPASGALDEQFHKVNGSPLGAADLTWSYASFLTATARRAGIVPGSWAPSVPVMPGTCSTPTQAGSYVLATNTNFPANQPPLGGAPPPTTTPPCTVAPTVEITFEMKYGTQLGQNIKLIGNVPELGSWNTANAISMSSAEYTSSNPQWKQTVVLKAGTQIQYKFIVVNADGSITWERDPNRSWTVPTSCRKSMGLSDAWQT